MASMDVDFILVSEDESDDESDLCETDEDDSDDDPTFDLVAATQKALSNLSMKKTTPRTTEKKEHEEGYSKSFEAVEKLIKGKLKALEQYQTSRTSNGSGWPKPDADGKLDKLKIDQCKVYLKQHRLRLTGKKDILLNRIKEHLELKNGDGEKKYPVASFTMNCQGDACKGDVVMFEQTVYEMFSIASRSATGPPLGKRTVAGRIVHESYGEAKQQHTFTIEVLWSKGEKPLAPLYPLLIKGRNLYKLKTMRQKWDNEEERKKILQEKHERGNVARSSRQTRIQEKEMRKTQRENRRREKSHGKQPTRPILNFQDVTNHEQPHQTFAPEKHAHIQQNPPTRPNLEFVLPNERHKTALEQPQTVQSGSQTRPNHSFVSPNSGYPVQAIGRNIFVSGPSHQWGNGFNGQVPQQEPYHWWGPQRQVNRGYNAHGSSHYERRNVPPVSRQMCQFYMQGRCRFGQACKFRHE